MGVVVPNVKRLKRTPKKTAVVAEKKITPKRKAAVVKSKPETKANNATPKPKAVKSKPAPKKKSPKKKPIVNNTPAKKEQVNNSAPTNNVPEKRESSRKRAAPKIENDVPAKKIVKGKPAVATPAKKKPGRGRPPKANNVISPKKKETPKKPIEKPESTPVKAINDVKKKQSKPKPAKKSPAKAKKAVAAKTSKKTPAVEKTGSTPKVNKAKAIGRKQAKRGPAAKTKSVYLNPVIEIEPIEHFKAMTQVTRDFWIILHRMNEVKRNVRVVLPRMEALNKQGTIISHKEERNPLNKKYQPYMEKIKQLSAEEISNFVRKNKDYYVEKLNNIGKNDGNSKNSELKDQFKCHPFNSSQQLAMYLTLREIFNVPKSHFIECRHFFTVLMPEISCQLFAEIFHTKITSVPKLIKKLYPSAVSPF